MKWLSGTQIQAFYVPAACTDDMHWRHTPLVCTGDVHRRQNDRTKRASAFSRKPCRSTEATKRIEAAAETDPAPYISQLAGLLRGWRTLISTPFTLTREFAGMDSVTNAEPAITVPAPMTVSPPRTLALE